MKHSIGRNSVVSAQTVVKDSRITKLEAPYKEFDVSAEMDPGQRRQLACLVHENEDQLAEDPKHPSRTDMCEHAIETGEVVPIKERARRVPTKWEAEIERLLEEMLSVDPHIHLGSYVVLIRKKDGSWRFAIDYRRLNRVTKKDAYSLSNMHSIIDTLGTSVYNQKDEIF